MPKVSTDKKPSPQTPYRVSGCHARSGAGEASAIVFLAVAVFLMLCLASYDPKDPSFNVATDRPFVSNLCGLIGSHVADALIQLLGLSSLVVPVFLAVPALRLFLPGVLSMGWTGVCSVILLVAGLSGLLERFQVGYFLGLSVQHAGGTLGSVVHASVTRLLGSAGEIVLSLTLILLCVVQLVKVSVRSVAEHAAALAVLATSLAAIAWDRFRQWYEDRHSGIGHLPGVNQEILPIAIREKGHQSTTPLECEPEETLDERLDTSACDIHSWERISFLPTEATQPASRGGDYCSDKKCSPVCQDLDEGSGLNGDDAVPWKRVDTVGSPPASPSDAATQEKLEAAIDEYLEQEVRWEGTGSSRSVALSSQPKNGQPRPIKVAKRADEKIAQPARRHDCDTDDDYQLPPLDLLDIPPASRRSIDESLLEANAGILEQKLADLGIKGDVVEVHPGPVITMYELILASGIPLRKVLNTSDDLAMALKSGSTRVVAPIPGKDTVGIEVPNLNREIVYFREIIESAAFADLSAPLKMSLGKGIDGEPVASSLARMPHLLIAGATGTGKSVGLNCLICSWLMSCHPDDVKFLMVDPKKLELSYYQDIPHLLHPVVTEAEKVPKVLSWAIKEMERRYDLLSKAGAKNIEGYNQQVMAGELSGDADDPGPEKLPYVVIIVDELAELMMVAAKDIEISIARLAQMARAAGIHLILATQRPSVDVITGVIKANFPARISFQVSARPDSRTILDTTGAENLLGMGDMLFLPPGTSKMRRIHGAYVSENEIKKIVDFIKAQRAPVYLQELAKHVSEDDSRPVGADLIEDEKYDEAVELVARLGHASISLIQRHMRIGYNRAARIIEAMEAEGIIGPSDGTSRPREVLARSLASIPDSPAESG